MTLRDAASLERAMTRWMAIPPEFRIARRRWWDGFDSCPLRCLPPDHARRPCGDSIPLASGSVPATVERARDCLPGSARSGADTEPGVSGLAYPEGDPGLRRPSHPALRAGNGLGVGLPSCVVPRVGGHRAVAAALHGPVLLRHRVRRSVVGFPGSLCRVPP